MYKNLGEGKEKVHVTTMQWPEMNCGGRLGLVNYRTRLGL